MVINTGDVRYLLLLDSYNELPDYDLDALNNAWFAIYNEFSDIAGGNRSDLYLVRQKRIISMKLDHDLKACMVRTAADYPHPDLLDLLRENGITIDPEDVEGSLKAAQSRVTHLRQKISNIEKDYTEKPQKGAFDKLIVTLEKFQGYQFDEQKMNVSKFASIYKNYKDAGAKDNV